MGRFTDGLIEQLDVVLSASEGFSLINASSELLSHEYVVALRARAAELRAIGDSSGAEEFEAWASHVRNIITRSMLFSTSPASFEDGQRLLAAQKERFDDSFVDFCAELAGSRIAKLQAAIASSADQLLSTAADAAFFEAGFVIAAAVTSGRKPHLAQANFVMGSFLTVRVQLEEHQGDPSAAAETRKLAATYLSACANEDDAPASLRARAECNLAVLAGPDRPDEVGMHQAAAQRFAEIGDDRAILRTIRRDRAYWAVRAGNWTAAYDLYKGNIDDTEKALWGIESPIKASELVSETADDYLGIVEGCLEQAKSDSSFYERALEYAEQGKARAFLRSLATIASASGPVPVRLLNRRTAILERLRTLGDNLALMPSEVGERHRTEAENLLRDLATTEEQIDARLASRAYDMRCVPASFAELVEAVPDGGIILSYLVRREGIILFLLDGGGLVRPPVQIDLSEEDLARAVVQVEVTIQMRARYRSWDEIQRKLDMQIDAIWPTGALRFLYHKLIEPAEAWLNERSLIYIVGHGCLNGFPFHALLNQADRPLIDRAPIAYAPGMSILRYCLSRHPSPSGRCFAAGVTPPRGPSSALMEATAIAGIFGTAPRAATRTAVLTEANESALVHIACHSDFGNPFTTFAGLVLEDGPLLQAEIRAMRCNASLVTLSGCRTGGSDALPGYGKELSGLVGAFFKAGCPSVVASLWPVADSVALPLMETFYHVVANKGSHAEAMREAQRAVLADSRYEHPYFWAPFCVWGMP